MNTSLQELQQTLANLQRQSVTVSQPAQQQIDVGMLREMVKDILLELPSREVSKPVKPTLTIQDSICAGLNKEEQDWLCTETNILGLPDFFVSAQGKEVTKLFISTYMEYVNANNT
jgi:hypothetical protein